jgi:hypothetical protein
MLFDMFTSLLGLYTPAIRNIIITLMIMATVWPSSRQMMSMKLVKRSDRVMVSLEPSG